VTVIAAPVLAYFQRLAVPHPIVFGWLLYAVRCLQGSMTRAARHHQRKDVAMSVAFAVALGGSGWLRARYPANKPVVEPVFLVFVLGIMLGSVPVGTPNESFVVFLCPPACSAIKSIAEGDQDT
jgi:hypothetical protein